MNELAKIFNRYFLKVVKPGFKWTAIIGIIIVTGVGVSQTLLVPMFNPKKDDAKVEVRKNSSGQDRLVYGKKATPQNYDQEMNMPAGQLIFQNQSRFLEETQSENEDNIVKTNIQKREQERLRVLTKNFLEKWETYSTQEDKDEYAQSLVPYIDKSSLNDIANHIDDRPGAAVGIGKETGSKAFKTKLYSYQLRVLRYDGDTAYAALVAPVVLTGPTLQWSGRSFNKTYAFVYRRIGYKWKITRASAQVLGEVEHFDPATPPTPQG